VNSRATPFTRRIGVRSAGSDQWCAAAAGRPAVMTVDDDDPHSGRRCAPAAAASTAAAKDRPLPLIGIIPSFVLASYALTQPWARRASAGVGHLPQPEAASLVIMALAGMLIASVTVAFKTAAGCVGRSTC